MIICSRCKGENEDDAAVYCCGCGSRMDVRPPIVRGAEALHSYPTMRGMDDTGPAHNVSNSPHGKDKNAAAVFSFLLPAGGQFYNRDFKKALLLLGSYILASSLDATAIALVVGVPLGLGTWIYSIRDAYKVAAREKARW